MKNIPVRHFIVGTIIGALVTLLALNFLESTTSEEDLVQQQIATYYANSAATLVSPHNIRERMSHGKDNFVLVDVRTEEDYVREHIVGAVNIDTGQALDTVLSEFKTLVAENPDKEIIIYCYSAACMNGRKAGNFLAENGVFVKEMTVGWNEWRYGWEMWNYDTEWDEYKVEDYVVSGAEPGVPPEPTGFSPCPIDGELSC